METIIHLLLLNYPEALLMLAVGSAVFNKRISFRNKSVLLFIVIYGTSIFIFEKLYFDMKVLFNFTSMVLLVWLLLKESFWRSLFISIATFIFSAMGEFFVLFVFQFFSISLDDILQKPVFLYAGMCSYFLVMSMFLFLMRKYNFDITRLFPRQRLHRYLFFMVVVGSVIALLIWMSVYRLYLQEEQALLLYGFSTDLIWWIILGLFVLLMILFWRYTALSIAHTVSMTEGQYLHPVKNLVASYDLITRQHIDKLRLMDKCFAEGKHGEVAEIVSQIVREGAASTLSKVEGVGNPAIKALLVSKEAVCVARNIPMSLAINSKSQLPKMKTVDLVKILGNLLDNAITAVLSAEENPYIRVEWNEDFRGERLAIENSGSTIPKHHLDKIFQQGFTTKNGEGGTGLAIVKKVVDQYKGKIAVQSENGVTRFVLFFPK